MEEGGFCRGKGLINISENLDDGGGRVACEQTLGGRVGAGRGEGARELACGLGEGRGEV